MDESRWTAGDMFGLDIPASAEALRAGGEDLLTRLFHRSGVLTRDNRVSRISRQEVFSGGGTGSKMVLDVEYQRPDPTLNGNLFVKFSRNFDDPVRDSVRHMLKPEIEFAALSRDEGFPITIPECYFADFNRASGTGVLITRRIPYGENGYEPHYLKCMDHLLPQPLEHYKAIMRSLARLAGTHKSGGLSEAFYRQFPFDKEDAVAADPLLYRGEKLKRRLSRLTEFARRYPRLLPQNVGRGDFLDSFVEQVVQFVAVEQEVRRALFSNPDYIALCHWNANIDNAWFWQSEQGELTCGLMDWGAVGQMSVAKSIYGAFSGAPIALWDNHLEEILQTFIDEYQANGGPRLALQILRQHVLLFAGLMGVGYLMDAVAITEKQVQDLDTVDGLLDPRILENEDVRVQLHMLCMFLNLWQTRNIGALVAPE